MILDTPEAFLISCTCLVDKQETNTFNYLITTIDEIIKSSMGSLNKKD